MKLRHPNLLRHPNMLHHPNICRLVLQKGVDRQWVLNEKDENIIVEL
jgi:hypothetical protein